MNDEGTEDMSVASSSTPSESQPAVDLAGREKGEHGCVHYRRRCRLVAPCCGEQFWCRHCHNEAKSQDEMVCCTPAVMCSGYLFLHKLGNDCMHILNKQLLGRIQRSAMSWIARLSRSLSVPCAMQDSLSASTASSVMLPLGLIPAWTACSLMTIWRRSSSTAAIVAYAEWVVGRDSFTATHAVVVTTRGCRYESCESCPQAAIICHANSGGLLSICTAVSFCLADLHFTLLVDYVL